MTSSLVNCPPDCTCVGRCEADEVVTAKQVIAEHLARCDLPLASCWICSTEFGIVKVFD